MFKHPIPSILKAVAGSLMNSSGLYFFVLQLLNYVKWSKQTKVNSVQQLATTLPHRYGNSHAIWRSVLPATWQRWESHLYSQSQPKQVHDLATQQGCKAELTYVTWRRTGWELNPRHVSRNSNVLPQRHHATPASYGLQGTCCGYQSCRPASVRSHPYTSSCWTPDGVCGGLLEWNLKWTSHWRIRKSSTACERGAQSQKSSIARY